MRAKDLIIDRTANRDTDEEAEIYHLLKKAEWAEDNKYSSIICQLIISFLVIGVLSACFRWWHHAGICLVLIIASCVPMYLFRRYRKQAWEDFKDRIYTQNRNVYFYKNCWKDSGSYDFHTEKQIRIAVTKEVAEDIPTAGELLNKINEDHLRKTFNLSIEIDNAMKPALEDLAEEYRKIRRRWALEEDPVYQYTKRKLQKNTTTT